VLLPASLLLLLPLLPFRVATLAEKLALGASQQSPALKDLERWRPKMQQLIMGTQQHWCRRWRMSS
jgi:hypothetical protein